MAKSYVVQFLSDNQWRNLNGYPAADLATCKARCHYYSSTWQSIKYRIAES